jgi:hypothetical protein
MTPIAPLIKAFLRETLSRQRGASRHTQDSYALSFQLLFVFAAGRLKIAPSALTLEQIDARLVTAFLEHLEDVRKNAAVTPRRVYLAPSVGRRHKEPMPMRGTATLEQAKKGEVTARRRSWLVPDGAEKVARGHAEGGCQFIQRHDSGVSEALFEAADVLLAEPGDVGEFLLGQPLLLSDPPHVPPDQPAHVHAPRSADHTPRVYQL